MLGSLFASRDLDAQAVARSGGSERWRRVSGALQIAMG
jgi:hypothetical protein